MKRWLGVMASMAMLTLGIAAPSAMADGVNPGISEIDSYAYLSGSASAKSAFQSSTTSNYLGGNTNTTLEMWIRPSETMTSGQYTIFVKTDMVAYETYNGVYRVTYNGGTWKSAISTGIPIRAGQWQHIAYVKTGNSMTFYFNGDLAFQVTDATNIPTTPNNTSTYVSLGSNPWNGSSNQSTPQTLLLAADIDEVKVWTTARNQSQIQTSMSTKIASNSSGLASYWDFNGTSSSTIHDRTGLLDLVAYGSPAPTYPDVKTTSVVSGKSVLSFPRTYLPSSGKWSVPAGVTNVDALVVGGGGGGAGNSSVNYNSAGGGGGGGGVYYATSVPVSDSITISVGTGGYGGLTDATPDFTIGGKGNPSAFGTITAGGGGGAGNTSGSPEDNQNGGNGTAGGGGGGASNFYNAYTNGTGGTGSSVTVGGTTYSAQNGYAGAKYVVGSSSTGNAGGGGGARGAASVFAVGTGFSSSITGTTVQYGRGGGAFGVTYWSFIAATNVPGQGGDGAYNTTTATRGANGGPGIVILSYIVGSTLTPMTISSPLYKGISNSISVTSNAAGKVTFFANGKKIGKCISIAVTSGNSYTATCNWKPAVRGYTKVSATFTPSVIAMGALTTVANTYISARSTTR